MAENQGGKQGGGDRPDVLILGAGPGGYVAAIKAAQLGLGVTLIEREALGGVCLNWGCIPSKALIHAAHVLEQAHRAESMGITCQGVSLDMPKLIAWKDGIVSRLTGGIGQLLKKAGVEVVYGEGRFVSAGAVEVKLRGGGTRTFEPADTIIAAGAVPIELPGLAPDGEHVIGARGALALKTLPRRLVVVGGGYIGLELGTALAKLGSEVTVVELLDTVLAGTDPELVKWVTRKLKKSKVKVLLRSKVEGYEEKAGELHARITDKDGRDPKTIVCDKILSAVGFRPAADALGLDAAGVETDERGHITIDARCRTSAEHIYAIGDITGAPYLAHRASKQGMVAAEVLAGRLSELDVRAMPAAVFTDPEIATVGLSEQEATEQGYEVTVGRFPFSALGRGQTVGEAPPPGLVKLVAEKQSGLVLGAGIAGHSASDLIAELTLAIEMGATAEDIALTVHAHPTFAEATMEAAEAAVHGKAIHAM